MWLYAYSFTERGWVSVGVMSKTPIEVVCRRMEGFWHGMLHVRTAGIDVIATHLSPFDWKFRQKEAKMIISYVDSLKLEDYFVAGDFNAISPLDADEIITHKTWIRNIKRGMLLDQLIII